MQCDVFIINCDVVRADIKIQWIIKGLEHKLEIQFILLQFYFSNYNILGRNLIPGLSRHTPFNILYHGNFIIITVYALRRKYENLSAFRNSYYYFSFYILIYFSKYFGLTEFKRLKLLQIIKKIISFIFHLVTALLIRAIDVF